MRTSHKDLLTVQKSVEIEGWLGLVDDQDSVDSMIPWRQLPPHKSW